MRHMFIALALAAGAAIAAPSFSQAQTVSANGTVQITLDNVRHREGVIRAELRTEQTWRGGRRAAGIDVPVPASGPVIVTFTNVPAGRYAVRLYQDRNSDNTMQTNFVGLPTEPWGLSNNARVVMSMPEFSAAAFAVAAGQTAQQTIRLR